MATSTWDVASAALGTPQDSLILKRERHYGEHQQLNGGGITVSEKPPFCSHQSNNWFAWNYLWTVKLSKSLHTGHLIITLCSALRWSLADTTWTKGSTAKKQTDWRHVIHGREGNPSLMERYHHRSISWPNRRKHQTNPKGDLPQNWPVLFKSVNVRDKGRMKNYSDERRLKRCDHWSPCMISNWILDEGKLCSEGHYWDNW